MGGKAAHPEQQFNDPVQRQFEAVKGRVAKDPAVQHEVTVH